MTAPPTPQLPATEREVAQRFTSTPWGARLARHLVLYQLNRWGVPYGTPLCDDAATVVAELAANAVTHGRVPGRDFELRLALSEAMLRIEVSDTCTECRPPAPGEVSPPPALADSGRGLLLVEALADRWTVVDRDCVGKTVRVELDLPRAPST
ncbi:ATP-binding protein [Streptomyces fildesensis]|uniref:ATP-binding protein n=1 Tax=Streptomyces fildesensis TaxID=375757 RepID=A0ABW8CMU0_9ACTN